MKKTIPLQFKKYLLANLCFLYAANSHAEKVSGILQGGVDGAIGSISNLLLVVFGIIGLALVPMGLAKLPKIAKSGDSYAYPIAMIVCGSFLVSGVMVIKNILIETMDIECEEFEGYNSTSNDNASLHNCGAASEEVDINMGNAWGPASY